MGDAPNTTQDTNRVADEAKGKASEGKQETQTQKVPKTYSQAEVDQITANLGRQIRSELKTVTKERDDHSQKSLLKDTEISTLKQSIEELNAQIEELSKEDTDKAELIKLRREAKARLTAVIDREDKVSKRERDQLVYDIADEYVKADGSELSVDDYNSFMKSADRWKANTQTDIEELAKERGWKKKVDGEPVKEEPVKEEPKQPLTLVSGATQGGKTDKYTAKQIQAMSPKELIEFKAKHGNKSVLELIAEGVIIEK